MISFKNGGRIIQSVNELPKLRGCTTLFCDMETTSGDPKKKSTDPWHDCDIAGICITADDKEGAWYIPVGHHEGDNLPKEPVYEWLLEVIDSAREWVNHNIKYDAHVITNWAGILPCCELVCTLTQAKIIDSDRMLRGGYSLEALSRTWLKEDIRSYESALKPYLDRNKDYGAVPIDILGEYGCQDVITNRRLWKFIQDRMPEQCAHIAQVERELTTVLFHMERVGMRVKPLDLKSTEYVLMHKMIKIDEELQSITGRSFNPVSPDDCYDVLCNQYGLPVLSWTKEGEEEDGEHAGNPSFNKKALAQYSAHPYAPHKVVALIQEYRRINIINNLFVKKYQEIAVDEGVLHPSYNQAVRTGRMSCKKPNAQQLNKEAKALIVPPDGYSFLSIDYSQIEFRLIVHYINDYDAIEAYNADPDTDFHQWVADMCGISRKPAKNVNFAIGYGQGKSSTISQLAANMELVGELKARVDTLIEDGSIKEEQGADVFKMLCERRATKVFESYHNALPGLRRTSRRAADSLKAKGYVYNLMGRHRHLPLEKAHISFNTLNQSSAADLIKERMTVLYWMLKPTPIDMIAQVHDELLFQGPTDVIRDPRTIRDIIGVMEHPPIDIRVPLRCSYGISEKSWRDAGSEEKQLSYDKEDCDELEWLKFSS